MTKYDHAVFSYRLIDENTSKRMADDFAKIGAQGFELVQVVSPSAHCVMCFFKKRIEEDYDFG